MFVCSGKLPFGCYMLFVERPQGKSARLALKCQKKKKERQRKKVEKIERMKREGNKEGTKRERKKDRKKGKDLNHISSIIQCDSLAQIKAGRKKKKERKS